MEFAKKKILIIGLGKSGLSAARWLVRAGADVTINDFKNETDLDLELLRAARGMGIILETGRHTEESFLRSDTIVLSPGVPLDIGPLKAARERGIPVLGEMELAARLIDTPIVAVTGTNGKSTVVSLLGKMIESAGATAFVGGNIGTPLMDYAYQDSLEDYAVVEVSSFQLDTAETFCPAISLILNISPDHLDRYPDYEAYILSKLKIVRNQRAGHYTILNDDDKRLSQFRPKGAVTVLRYGMEQKDGRQAFINGRRLTVRLPGLESNQFDTGGFRLPGIHNLENLMAACLAGMALGLSPESIQESIDHFKGLAHRMELIRTVKGIDFHDNSKATNVDSASRSIASFDRPVILIAGGRHKGSDYSPLVTTAQGRVKEAILLGEAKQIMAGSFEGLIPFTMAEDMENAVSRAFEIAIPGDVVLLAPACSSFDMYSDYTERGDRFIEAVEMIDNGS
ncbi:MAG: UDP-N-acetylmuramoyl-L-alanine--D-glutamate ligase [Deltaproteobacteria bacterium]|nr:UDP-N-acetylmuramoyl-L-alanine--D-glutamate ligase [Deltaproteobacteria bacterium]